MSNAPQTYSPSQYLEAGYHAEKAGELDRAAQYYVYLAESFPETPEGEAARGGLIRMGMANRLAGVASQQAATPVAGPATARPGRQAAYGRTQTPMPGATQGGAGAASVASHGQLPGHSTSRAAGEWQAASQRPAAHGHVGGHQQHGAPQPGYQQRHGDAPNATWPHEEGRPAQHGDRIRLAELQRSPLTMGSAPNAANSPAVLEAEAGDTMRLPEIVARRARELADGEAIGHLAPGHPKGRVVAVVLIWLGWIAVSGGLALVAIGLSGYSAALGESVAGLPLGAVAGAPLVLIGLCLVLAGYVSIATFDTSDAIREIKLLTRARADL